MRMGVVRGLQEEPWNHVQRHRGRLFRNIRSYEVVTDSYGNIGEFEILKDGEMSGDEARSRRDILN